MPKDAAPECMELMTGLIHPYNLTYVRCCQVLTSHLAFWQGFTFGCFLHQASVQSCLLQGNLKQALDWCHLLLGTARSLARCLS